MDRHDTGAEGDLRPVSESDTVTDVFTCIKAFGYCDTALDIYSHESGFALEASDEGTAATVDAGNVIRKTETDAAMRSEGNLARRRSVAHGDGTEKSAKLLGNVLLVEKVIQRNEIFIQEIKRIKQVLFP